MWYIQIKYLEPDTGAKLMGHLQKPDRTQWVAVFLTHSLPEAHIVAGRLLSAAIPAMVHVEPGASAMGIQIGSLGEIQVLVHLENYEIAMDVLELSESNVLPDSIENVIYLEDDDEDIE
jgi:hypothetical protein